jgi:hypothetical protein
MTEVKVLLRSDKAATRDSRVPAVIGTKPFSWRGDDNTGNMIHAAAARRMMSKSVEYEGPGEWSEADMGAAGGRNTPHSYL